MGSTSWRERAETEASLRRLLPTLDALLQQLDRVTGATEDLYHIECRLEHAQRKRRHTGREKGGRGQGGRGQAGQREKGEDLAGWTERKGGKEKHKGGKKGKKMAKGELPKDCSTASNIKKTPAAKPATFLKPRSASVAAHTPTPQTPAKPSGSRSPPTPVIDKSATDSLSLPISSASAPPADVPLAKTPTAPPCTPATTPSLPFTPAPTPISRDWDSPTEREILPSSSLFNHPAHTTTIPTRKRKRKPPPLKNKVHPNLDRHGPGHPKI